MSSDSFVPGRTVSSDSFVPGITTLEETRAMFAKIMAARAARTK